MVFSEKTVSLLTQGAFVLFLGSALIGGHLTGSYLLLEPDYQILDTYALLVGIIALVNLLYFMGCLVVSVLPAPGKGRLLRYTLLMLANIPIAIGYLVIILVMKSP